MMRPPILSKHLFILELSTNHISKVNRIFQMLILIALTPDIRKILNTSRIRKGYCVVNVTSKAIFVKGVFESVTIIEKS